MLKASVLYSAETLTGTGESFLPGFVLCAREPNVHCWRTHLTRVLEIFIKCMVYVVSIEVPQIVFRKLQLIWVSFYFTKEKDMTVALFHCSFCWFLEMLHDWQVLREQLVVKVIYGSRTNNSFGTNLCYRHLCSLFLR